MKLLFDFDQRSHTDSAFAQFTQVFTNVDNNLEKERQKNRDRALQATDAIRNYNKNYQDLRNLKPTIYKEGDYVLVRDTRNIPGVNTKLKPNYKGPYLVAKALGNNRYVIRDIPGFNLMARPLDTILSAGRIEPWVRLRDPKKDKNKFNNKQRIKVNLNKIVVKLVNSIIVYALEPKKLVSYFLHYTSKRLADM